MEEPRAKTPEEVREQLLRHFKFISKYWATLDNKTTQERCDGLVFSILSTLDGSSLELPSFDLIPSPHPDDKEYYIDNGENWIEPVVINDTMLHEEWHRYE